MSVWYDPEGDMLEVLWDFREGYFTTTVDNRVLKRLDDSGKVIGFLVHEMSTFGQTSPFEFMLKSEETTNHMNAISVRAAALELGVSERRVRQLASNGRVRGAAKVGQEWLIPTPVEVIPGSRGPSGIAGRI